MSQLAIELALKRQRLQTRIGEQRSAMAAHVSALRPVFSAADTIYAGFDWIKRNPEWLAGTAVVVVVVRPKFALRLARRGFLVWRTVRRVRAFVADALNEGGRASG